MRVSHAEGLLYVMAILFVVLSGSLALPAQCYPEHPDARGAGSDPGGLSNTSSNSSLINSMTGDETRFVLKFCTRNRCDHGICFCCHNEQICYDTWEDCKANCPACNPNCPPPPSRGTTMEDPPLRAVTNGTS
ncbi:hypothetical protein ACP70R_016416 [Stipagrostis hirtigluma subsp. patula]